MQVTSDDAFWLGTTAEYGEQAIMRRTKILFEMVIALGLVFSMTLYGCNGDDNKAGNADIEDARDAARDTLNTSIQVFVDGTKQILETGGGTSQARGATMEIAQAREPFEVTVTCSASGQATLTGLVTTTGTNTTGSFTFDAVVVTYNACNDLSGTLTFAMDGTFSGNIVSFTITLDGAVANTCAMDIEGLTIQGTTDTRTEAVTGTTSGSLNATCNGTTVSCTWQDVDIHNEAALEAACSGQ